MIVTVQVILFGLLCLLALNFLLNWRSIRVISPDGLTKLQSPLLSVLVPARNEERNIAACVESLLAQDYINLEVLVLDDQSQDGTGARVAEIASRNSRVRLLAGAPLPPDWVGKCWACHQLSEAARGEWFLFTDADTRFEPSAISTSLAYAIATRADLLSILPRQEAENRGVQLVLPLLYFTLYTLLPGAFLQGATSPAISAAIGQFLLFRREAYRDIDGHRGVANSIVEDLQLAKAMKSHKRRVVLADGHRLLSCRMYGSMAELWAGFTKNLFASFSYSSVRLGTFIVMNAALYLFPFLSLGLWAAGRLEIFSSMPRVGMFAAQVSLPYLLRFALARRHPGRLLALALHPLAVAVMIAIGCNSLYRIISRRGVDWKGRTYNCGR